MRARFHVQGNFRFRGRFEPLSTAQRGLLAIVTVFYRTGPQGHLYPADVIYLVILAHYLSYALGTRARIYRLRSHASKIEPGPCYPVKSSSLCLHHRLDLTHLCFACRIHIVIILCKLSICYMLYAASLCLRHGFVLMIIYDARTIVWVLTIFVFIGHLFQILHKNGAIVARKFYLVRTEFKRPSKW